MARVTVEDCIEVVNNRFKLVLMAAQRARDISAGQSLYVDRDNDKNAVVALREIAERLVDMDELEAHIVSGVNRRSDANSEDDMLSNIQSEGWLTEEQINEIKDSSGASIEEIEYDDGEGKEAASEEGAEESAENAEGDEPSEEELKQLEEAVKSEQATA